MSTKLGALAASSLREKRRVGRGSPAVAEEALDHHASDILEVTLAEDDDEDSPASGPSSGRERVYSFFDPKDIRRPPTSPTSPVSNRGGAAPMSPLGGGGVDDAASTGSAATERIGNRKPARTPRAADAAVTAANVRPSTAAFFEEEGREVPYEEGATELFMLVEDAKWEDVCDRVEEEPSEARTWVVSSGTENTVFSWSVWRRLPLHEACRRQPPPVVIYSLLGAYPESAMAESNFGELPLHAAVRCGACAEVVNCILASYPAAAVARDNSGCTPLDILNGTGKMMDHDAVVAALNRTIAVLTKEEQSWEEKIAEMQQEYKQSKDKRRREYEGILADKNAEIEDLKRTLDQEQLATSNLAAKVIATEQVVQDKGKVEKRHAEKMKRMEEEIVQLKSSNSSRKSKIKDLEEIVRSDRKAILELNNRVQILQSSLTSLLEEEEAFASTKLAKAEENFKTMMENQFVFLRETERRKDLLRGRVKQLGIKIPLKKKTNEKEEKKKAKKLEAPPVEEVSNNEVAEKALASAMAHLNHEGEDDAEEIEC